MAHSSTLANALLLLVVLLIQQCLCQNSTPTAFTDNTTGITFDLWTVPDSADGGGSVSVLGGLSFGVALPEDALTANATELIGYLKCGSNGTTTNAWCGISFGGSMTNSLLVMAWPYEGQVLTSFRFASGYVAPDVYTGNATLTQISSTIDKDHFSLIFRCQDCLAWDQDRATGATASTSSGALLLGWASSLKAPTNPACPADIGLEFHSNGDSLWSATLDKNAANPSYTAWASKATATVTGSCSTATPTTTTSVSTTATTSATGVPVPTATYDYIVVGAGAGGIPLADKLSEAGNSVLLIEKGSPSSGRWGGSLKPEWLDDTNLTRFDVPGLCNQIWVDSTGIACTDTDQMAGCVLGGGTAVNSGLWWKPYSLDWDYNFPEGWQSADMAAATARVFSRIPGTYSPSMDGKLYYQQGFDVLSGGLKTAGWTEVAANDVPDEKNHIYSHTPFMFSGGERGGPMATYLVSASERKNFNLWMNTAVKRVVRVGGHVTGIEVEPFLDGGYMGVVNVTSVTGRVILSAGTFGSAKILLRSGIGPSDQLEVVQSSTDGPTMIANTSWIDLPVGYNLEDHTNTDTVITHPDVIFYDYYGAWDSPNTTDKDQYIDSRSGMLAQAAPNIGPMFWDEITGDDGIVRQLQWTARVEGSDGTPSGTAMTMSQYLGRGATSRGRMTITKALTTVVSTLPYLRDKNDVQAVIQGIKNLQAALSNVQNLTWTYPSVNTTVEDFVNNMLVSYTNRRSNHWIGTNKLGTDDGRANGSAVVDLDTRVYGTDNLFVVDASIFPGHITTNPSAYIVIAAEHASERILGLALPEAQPQSAQCGGVNWTGSFQCASSLTCTYQNETFSQCL
ncbi:carbohydrate-binding module family 1 protein [Rostrohypoxylon terebratum]|nr:carbohydrate-binding module family 1 protein [Rostrohypoxylon terebratum]